MLKFTQKTNQLYDSCVSIGITILGKTALHRLVDQLGVDNLLDVLNLTKDKILSVKGFDDISANSLFAQITHRKNNPVHDWEILSSLNINGLGPMRSMCLLSDRTLLDLRRMTVDQILDLKAGLNREEIETIGFTLEKNNNYVRSLISVFPKLIEWRERLTVAARNNEPQIDKDLDINNLYAERRNKDGIYFLSNLMRCSRPQGFMMFSSYNNSIESQKTKFDAAVRLLLAATGIQQSDTNGTIKEDSVLYKDATDFCEMVPFVKESKEYIYK